MYQSFSIISVEPKFADKQIVIHASFDIDPASANDSTIRLFSKKDRTDVNIQYRIDQKVMTILLEEDIVPNTEYILRINNGLKNILGDGLSSGIRRSITFKSEVEEMPYILSPSEYEEVTDLRVRLAVTKESDSATLQDDKMYFIQISRDVLFIDVVTETTTDQNEINLKDLIAGQYYIRARVEKIVKGNKEVGRWSEVVTFISMNETVSEPGQDTPDVDEPEYFEEVYIVNQPSNGETPETILIEFSGEIDPDSIDNIIVIRRDI